MYKLVKNMLQVVKIQLESIISNGLCLWKSFGGLAFGSVHHIIHAKVQHKNVQNANSVFFK